MPTHDPDRNAGSTAEHETRRPPFAAPNVWVLAVIDGERPNAVYRLDRYETVIGRGEGISIDLPDEEVSKRQCLVRVEGPVCTVQDLGSLNGTRVNGRKIPTETALRLRHLDEIQVGSTRLFVLGGAFKRITPR